MNLLKRHVNRTPEIAMCAVLFACMYYRRVADLLSPNIIPPLHLSPSLSLSLSLSLSVCVCVFVYIYIYICVCVFVGEGMPHKADQ